MTLQNLLKNLSRNNNISVDCDCNHYEVITIEIKTWYSFNHLCTVKFDLSKPLDKENVDKLRQYFGKKNDKDKHSL